jgi:integrase
VEKTHLKLVAPTTVLGTVAPPRRKTNAQLRPREYLTEAEIERLRKAAGENRHGFRDAAMILFAFRHGFRPSELCALRWDAIDLDHGKIHCNRRKNGAPSVHPLAGVELRTLRRVKRESPPSPFVFVTERGAPFTVGGFRRMIGRLGTRASFRVHPHMLRHACGYKLANDGVDTDRCSTISGIRIFSTRSATPSWRRIASRGSGRIDRLRSVCVKSQAKSGDQAMKNGIWNEAIEAAAQVAEASRDWPIASKIRALKKPDPPMNVDPDTAPPGMDQWIYDHFYKAGG